MSKLIISFLLFLVVIPLLGQSDNIDFDKPTVVMNATIHTGDGRIIENGLLAFFRGKITFLADARLVKLDLSGYQVIDAPGKHIYPGLIGLNSQLGIKEIELVRSTNDVYEVGKLNPNVRSIIAYNTDSRVIPTVLSNGILMAQIVPAGGTISGTSSVVSLDGWNWEDAVYAMDNGLHMRWPRYYSRSWNNGWTLKVNTQYENEIANLKRFFDESNAYTHSDEKEPVNLKLLAMKGIFNGEKKLYIEANDVREISNAVLFCDEYGIIPVIVGGAEANLITNMLKEREIPVVLKAVHQLPSRRDDDPSLPYKMPYLLQEAGVLCAISVSNDGSSYWNMRNLPFQAGTAAAYGLSKEEALQCVTLNPARILGIDETTGSLDLEKDATFLICDGDLLDMESSHIVQAFIQGKEVETRNWQEDLFDKYKGKYGLD